MDSCLHAVQYRRRLHSRHQDFGSECLDYGGFDETRIRIAARSAATWRGRVMGVISNRAVFPENDAVLAAAGLGFFLLF